MSAGRWPVGVSLSADIEYRPDRPEPYRARDRSRNRQYDIGRIRRIHHAAGPARPGGQDTRSLPGWMAQAGSAHTRPLATKDDHQRRRRSRRSWLDRRTVQPLHGENSLAVLVRIMEQAVRDGILDRNPAHVIGWQRDYQRAEDELDDPRCLALPDWQALCDLAAALVARSADHFEGWGDVVIFAACTAARIGEVSGVRCADIDRNKWT